MFTNKNLNKENSKEQFGDKKKGPRIFYLIPNLQKTFCFKGLIKNILKLNFAYIDKFFQGSNSPRGGIKISYKHCELLNTLGFNARPLLLGNFKIKWFEYTVKPVSITKIGYGLNKEDIIICPEMIPYEGLKFRNARKIMFIQSWIGATSNRKWLRKNNINKSYYELGYHNIITSGQYITDFLYKTGKGKAVTITNGIDHSKFIDKPELKRENSILYLSRKNPNDARQIIKKVKKKIPWANFVKANNLCESKMIKEYQKADIFLATGYPEGFALPPLEAMACGCVVIGFTGRGADEYMIDGETAMVAKDGDTDTAAEKLIELLQNKKVKEEIRLKGNEKSKEYSLERMKQALENFYMNL